MNQEKFQCPECGLHYYSNSIAQQCATWCKKHKSCNLEITKHSAEQKQKLKPLQDDITQD